MRLSLIEIILRLIPETCFVNYSIIKLSNNEFNKKKYIESCLIAVLCGYIVRSLPISNGIHIILNIISFAAISIIINKFDVVDTIKSIIIIFVVMMILEGLNILAITSISKDQINNILNDSTGKVILGIPSIIAYAVITFILYKRKKERGDTTHDSN